MGDTRMLESVRGATKHYNRTLYKEISIHLIYAVATCEHPHKTCLYKQHLNYMRQYKLLRLN